MKESGSSGLRAKVGERLTYLARATDGVVWWMKTYGNPYGRPGVPDYIVCIGGAFGAVELKGDDNEPTPKQARELALIAKAGGVTDVAYTMDEVDAFLRRLARSTVQVWAGERVIIALNNGLGARRK